MISDDLSAMAHELGDVAKRPRREVIEVYAAGLHVLAARVRSMELTAVPQAGCLMPEAVPPGVVSLERERQRRREP